MLKSNHLLFINDQRKLESQLLRGLPAQEHALHENLKIVHNTAVLGVNGKFQRNCGLTVDGIAGPKTLLYLGLGSGSSSSTNGYSSNDIYLLAKVIAAEARGESYTGQVAVGAVDIDAFEAAKDNFYSVRDQILNRDAEPEEKENNAHFDFTDALKQLLEMLSDILYIFFGGAGFGEMMK